MTTLKNTGYAPAALADMPPAVVPGFDAKVIADLGAAAGRVQVVEVWRADEVIRERLANDMAEVGNLTGLPVYAGTPEMAAA